MDEKKMMLGIFLDLTKAFDLVNHETLLNKLDHYGIRGIANTPLKSYLTNRKQYVQIKNEKSNFRTVEIGVPQGLVLGPLLFLIYVNDLKNAKSFSTKLFADDTCIFIKGDDPKRLKEEAELSFTQLRDWFQVNNCVLNQRSYNTIK